MDFDDDDDSLSLDKLYDRFNEALTGNKSLDDFEEDDYSDIFDYAGDICDEFTQTEVLMAGLKRFPKSRKLLERKLILYLLQGNDTGAIYVAERLPDSSIIGKIAWLRLSFLNDTEKLTADLDLLLHAIKKSSLSDEEVIQLADLANYCGIMDWLLERIIKISALSQFPATVYYEAAQHLVRSGDYGKAHGLLQTLTTIEPFNDVYWSFRAEIEADRLNDYEAALTSIEYSLAINPSPTKERMMKVHYLAMSKAPFEQVDKLPCELIADNPLDTDLRLYRAQLLSDYGHRDDAEEQIKAVYSEAFNHFTALSLAISICGDVPDWIDESYIAGLFDSKTDQEELKNYIRGLLVAGQYKIAIKLLQAGLSGVENDILFLLLTEALYLDGQYAELVRYWHHTIPSFDLFIGQDGNLADEHVEKIRQVTTNYPDAVTMYFLSLVRTIGVNPVTMRLKVFLASVMQETTPKLFGPQAALMSRQSLMDGAVNQR